MALQGVRPKGRESVRAAILQAAVEVAASGGPLSARAVARLAGVNHGQVHHLFAGKGGLHRAVLEYLAAGLDEHLADREGRQLASAALAATVDDPRFVRFLATYLVEHPDDPIPQESFPVVRRLAQALDEPQERRSRAKLASQLAAGLGWALFQRWILAALDLEPEDATLVESIITEVDTP